MGMFERYTEKALQVILLSQEESRRLGHNFVGTEELLIGLAAEGTGLAYKALKAVNADARKIRLEVANTVGRGTGFVAVEIPFTPRAKRILELSMEQARTFGHGYISTEHLLLAILEDEESVAISVLVKLGVNLLRLKTVLLEEMGQAAKSTRLKLTEAYQRSQRDKFSLKLYDIFTRKSDEFFDYSEEEEIIEEFDVPTLEEYTHNLSLKAENEELDPLIGRDKEVERVIQILSRRRKNNPVLIGEPGVGKTSIAEGLATKIYEKDVPSILYKKKVLVLDIGLLLAGTKYRGEFEDRLKRILEEVTKNIIIVIDEVHTLVGAGAAEGALDASNILKPALARGELQCIGATTTDEYRQHIEKDPALSRRFQPVIVGEPSVDETIDILNGLRSSYESHHHVRITTSCIKASARMGAQYIADRFLPDKAIDLLDEACSKVALQDYKATKTTVVMEQELKELVEEKEACIRFQNYEKAIKLRDQEMQLRSNMTIILENQKLEDAFNNTLKYAKVPVVNSQDIADVVGSWTGIPVNRIGDNETEKLLNLEKTLHQRVIGQTRAVSAISAAIRRARVGLRNPNRPIASFLFCGPTGVGKTELAKALASYFFGSEKLMIRFDMSEYMEKHTVAKLIGSPPGYVGFSDGGQLTEAVRRKPYSLVLLDEVEKAHPDIFNILLQVYEDGRLTDSKGKTIDFTNTIVIMTSNLGSHLISSQLEKKGLLTKKNTSKEDNLAFNHDVNTSDDVFDLFDTAKKNLTPKRKDPFEDESPFSSFKFKNKKLTKNEEDNRKTAEEIKADQDYAELSDLVTNELKNFFRPEFLNRIDDIIVFHHLNLEEIEKITGLMINQLKGRLFMKDICLEVSPEVKEIVMHEGFDPEYGARPVRRALTRILEDKIADEFLKQKLLTLKRVIFAGFNRLTNEIEIKNYPLPATILDSEDQDMLTNEQTIKAYAQVLYDWLRWGQDIEKKLYIYYDYDQANAEQEKEEGEEDEEVELTEAEQNEKEALQALKEKNDARSQKYYKKMSFDKIGSEDYENAAKVVALNIPFVRDYYKQKETPGQNPEEPENENLPHVCEEESGSYDPRVAPNSEISLASLYPMYKARIRGTRPESEEDNGNDSSRRKQD
uniref:Clp protease ATP binding subunit n=1 Tax=Fibrocapsa japonica TaxID=94617 RepID=UPI0021154749|nr:Clp protease ATP binding subunit [Fibrocapsa japonica]UTE95219.1 Clp protease ATP binding subunit [Fibrocapsa japonica]